MTFTLQFDNDGPFVRKTVSTMEEAHEFLQKELKTKHCYVDEITRQIDGTITIGFRAVRYAK